MGWLVSAVGAVIGLLAAVGIFAPLRVGALLRSWHSPSRFYFSIGLRLVLGVLFVYAAPDCRTPRLVFAIGVLSLAAAVGILFMGAQRLDALVAWWTSRSATIMALSFAGAAVFGCFLLYAGL